MRSPAPGHGRVRCPGRPGTVGRVGAATGLATRAHPTDGGSRRGMSRAISTEGGRKRGPRAADATARVSRYRGLSRLGRVIRRLPPSWGMATGQVDFFNDTGGYGFIETDEADDDVFVHMDDVEGPDLEEGEELEFEIVETDKGPRAQNPRRV